MRKTSLILSMVLAVTACSQKEASAPVAPPVPIAPVAQQAPALPTHFYAIKDGDEYGYEAALSENARQSGQVATHLRMFSYLGQKDGAYQVMLKNNDIRTVAECSSPCEFAKIYTFSGTKFIEKTILKLTPESILNLVFQDAMRDKLDVLSGLQNDQFVSLWVDGVAKKLTVRPAGLK